MLKRGFFLLCALLCLTSCRPELDFGSDEHTSDIDRVVVDATLDVAGVMRVSQRYTFASAKGATIGIADDAQHVAVDGEPVTAAGGTFSPQLQIKKRRATVTYDVPGAVDRYADVAVVTFNLLGSVDSATPNDPPVPLSGTLTLPEGSAGLIDPHLHAGRDRKLSVEGTVIHFSARAGIWTATNELDVGIPPSAVPFVQQIPAPYLTTFRTSESVRDSTDRTVERTLHAVDTGIDVSRWVLTALAFGIPGIFWLVVVKALLARLARRHRVAADIPNELSDPPTNTDPAVVAVLEGEGRPERAAVAGTILAMAHRKAIDLQKYGDKFVLKVPLTTMPTNGSEQLVLDNLRAEATTQGQDSVVEGQIWRSPVRWWHSFRRDAVNRARTAGLATRWMPLAPLSGALIGTGVGAGFFVFTDPLAYLAIIFGVQILSVTVSVISGWTLTDQGWRERALWHSFARYIRHQGKIDREVGPEGVVVWGPYLVYGAVLGEAHDAARPLTP